MHSQAWTATSILLALAGTSVASPIYIVDRPSPSESALATTTSAHTLPTGMFHPLNLTPLRNGTHIHFEHDTENDTGVGKIANDDNDDDDDSFERRAANLDPSKSSDLKVETTAAPPLDSMNIEVLGDPYDLIDKRYEPETTSVAPVGPPVGSINLERLGIDVEDLNRRDPPSIDSFYSLGVEGLRFPLGDKRDIASRGSSKGISMGIEGIGFPNKREATRRGLVHSMGVERLDSSDIDKRETNPETDENGLPDTGA